MGRRDVAERHGEILRELNAERAAALMRISRTLESLIEELHAARDRLARSTADERSRDLAHYRELRRRALTYRWYLEVQREALGLREHRMLDEVYAIPAALP